MRIETWKSDLGGKEVHHFAEFDDKTYLFGLNVELLGEEFYKETKDRVLKRIEQIQDDEAKRFNDLCEEAGVTKPFLEARSKEREPFDE